MIEAPWYADIVNFMVMGQLPSEITRAQKEKIRREARKYVWDDPHLWRHCGDQIIRRCVDNQEIPSILAFCHSFACGGHFGPKRTARKILECGLYWPTLFRDAYMACKACENFQKTSNLSHMNQMPNTPLLCARFSIFGASTSWGLFLLPSVMCI